MTIQPDPHAESHRDEVDASGDDHAARDPLAQRAEVAAGVARLGVRRVMDAQVDVAPEAGPEGIFPSATEYVRQHPERTRLNRLLKRADIIEQSKARVWSNMTIRICCSDGRIGQADFVDEHMSARTLAHKYAPQAGCLLISGPNGPGLGELKSESDLRAFYEREHGRINEVLRDRFVDDIHNELEWQRAFLERTNAKKQALEQYIREAEGDMRTDDPGLMEVRLRLHEITDEIRTVERKEIRIVFESHSDNSEYLAHPLDEEACAKSAHHGCGAHSNDMQAALAESVKQAFLTSLWIEEVSKGSERTAPYFTPEQAAKLKVVRMHNFTVEQRLVLSPDIDSMALDAEGNIGSLPLELVELGKRFVPADPRYQPPRGKGARSISRKDIERHVEPLQRVSMDQLAHLMPGIQALELTPSPDFSNTTAIESVLFSIYGSNYGKDHPQAPALIHLDAREIPEFTVKQRWLNEEARVANKKGELDALDALQMDPPWVELVEVPIEDEALLGEIRRKNAQELLERDAQLWHIYALFGRQEEATRMIDEQLDIIRARFGAPRETTIDQLLQILDVRDAEGALIEEDAVRTRLLLKYARNVLAFDREAYLAGVGEKRRAVMEDLAGRLAIVRSRTNTLTFDVAFDAAEEPVGRAA